MMDAPRGCVTGWHGSHDFVLARLFTSGVCDVCNERPACGSVSDEPVIQVCGCCAQDWTDWMEGHLGTLLGQCTISDEFAAVMETISRGRRGRPICTMQEHWRLWKRFVAFTGRERMDCERKAA